MIGNFTNETLPSRVQLFFPSPPPPPAALRRTLVTSHEFPTWLQPGPASSAIAGSLLGGLATTLASGPKAGLAGFALWGLLGYGTEVGWDRFQSWRQQKAAAVLRERALLARLTAAEQEEWQRVVSRNKSDRIEAIGGPGGAVKDGKYMPEAVELEDFVAFIEARRGVPEGTAPLYTLLRPARPTAEETERAGPVVSSQARPSSSSNMIDLSRLPSAESRPHSSASSESAAPVRSSGSSWHSWIPIRIGEDAERDRLQRLSTKLREIDELLDFPPEKTQADIVAAKGGGLR